MPINQVANSFPLSCLRCLFVCLSLSVRAVLVVSASAGKFLHMQYAPLIARTVEVRRVQDV